MRITNEPPSTLATGLPKESARSGEDAPLIPPRDPARPGFDIDKTIFAAADGFTLLQTSDGLGWSGLFVALTDEQPHTKHQGAVPELWLTLPLSRTHVHRTIGKRREHSHFEPYQIALAGPGMPVEDTIESGLRALHVLLKGGVLDEVAEELFDEDSKKVEIISAFGFEDASLGLLLRSAKHALLESKRTDGLRMDYLARALAADVLSKHAAFRHGRGSMIDAQRLSAPQTRRVIEYIREHLASDISLNELAAVAGLGRTVFVQRFKASLRQTPYQFLMALRIRRAQEMLTKTEFSISQIASICGFADQAHFSDTFKRKTGMPPMAFRRNAR